MTSATMLRVCAWCGASMGVKPAAPRAAGETAGPLGGDPAPITHGICDACSEHLELQLGLPLAEYLERLPAPILAVDGQGCVLYANQLARRALGKELQAIRGLPGGDVFECQWAQLPEGCGHTAHCAACSIRRTVLGTYASGQAGERQPVELQRRGASGPQPVPLRISTERVRGVVLLRIDG